MTLHELAKELNVSIATVSRALSRPEDVSPQFIDMAIRPTQTTGPCEPTRREP
jgi:hypothetical protein